MIKKSLENNGRYCKIIVKQEGRLWIQMGSNVDSIYGPGSYIVAKIGRLYRVSR